MASQSASIESVDFDPTASWICSVDADCPDTDGDLCEFILEVFGLVEEAGDWSE